MSIEEAFEETVLHYRLNEKVRDIAYIQAMQEQVHAFSTSRIADLPLFLKWWDETGAAQSISLPRNRNAITVITIHKAKGLQYKAVVLPDCDWSLQPKTGSLIWGRTDEKPFDSLKHMPLGWSKLIGESAFAEEFYTETVFSHIDNINLFYVAATRAEQELHIQIPRGGKETQRIGSLVYPDELRNVPNTAWSGKGAVTVNGRTYTVPASVPCYNTQTKSWVTLTEARAYADSATLYVYQGVVRFLEVG